ncbi:methyltransferase domain-containing protein [candidate division KSB1 bacterium]|nr:methyltransferase domain-containing protein [candidate division KSB1 bacterium]
MSVSRFKCPVCASSALRAFYTVRHVPVHCNLLWNDRTSARACPRGDIELAICENCGFITNVCFDEKLTRYSRQYDNSLFFSSIYREYAEQSAADLISRYNLCQKTIIDIGAGQGDFLLLLCRMGHNWGIGFDPAVDEARADEVKDHVLFVRDTYSERYSHYQADLFCCRHVLEHIQYPGQLLSTIQHATAGNSAAAVYFQVPNSDYTLSEHAIWDIIYEHCSYFTPFSLSYTFANNGFIVQETVVEFGEQYLSLYALTSGNREMARLPDVKSRCDDAIGELQMNADKLIKEWNARLQRMKDKKSTVVMWGAGSKGVSFLNMVEMGEYISAIVDMNPAKQGRFVPGSGHLILSPTELVRIDPDRIIVANPLYVNEVRRSVRQLKLHAEVVPL